MQWHKGLVSATSASLLVVLAGDFASADGIPSVKDRAIVSDSWTGRNFGIYYGAGMGSVDVRGDASQRSVSESPGISDINARAQTSSGSGDITGSVVNVFAGYNYQSGAAVFGAQLEGTVFSDLNLRAKGTSTGTNTRTANGVLQSSTTETFDFVSDDDLRSMFTLAGRAGFLLNPNMLLYGLLGVTYGHFVFEDGIFRSENRRGQWELGYMLGLGLEHRLNRSWSIRAEYRYVHFDVDRSASTSSTSNNAIAQSSESFATTSRTSTDVDLHLGKVGIVYKF